MKRVVLCVCLLIGACDPGDERTVEENVSSSHFRVQSEGQSKPEPDWWYNCGPDWAYFQTSTWPTPCEWLSQQQKQYICSNASACSTSYCDYLLPNSSCDTPVCWPVFCYDYMVLACQIQCYAWF
jgi:hypothetical protein